MSTAQQARACLWMPHLMLEALSGADLLVLVAALLAAGLFTGFWAGLFGVGGGGILVPVLYEVFGALGVDQGVRMQVSVGTSMAIIIPTTLRTFTAHRARGMVDMAVVKSLALPSMLGVVIGILTARYFGGAFVRLFWSVFASFMAIKLLIGQRDWRLGDHIPGQPGIGLFGIAVGFISAIMSIAGGLYVTMMMMLYGRPIHPSIATGTGVGPFISVTGMLGYIWAGWGVPGTPPFTIGFVNIAGAAIVAATSVLAAPYGIKAAYRLKPRHLEIGFGLFMMSAAARFLVSLW